MEAELLAYSLRKTQQGCQADNPEDNRKAKSTHKVENRALKRL